MRLVYEKSLAMAIIYGRKPVYADILMHMVYEFGQLRIRMVQYDGVSAGGLDKLGNRGVGVGNRTIPGIFLDIFRRHKSV